MKRLLSIPFSILTITSFLFFLCLFLPIQIISLRLFGYKAHKRSVDALTFFLLRVLWFNFTTASISFKTTLPTDKPIIFVANHQGVFDIVGMGWFLRKYHLKYVSKIELGKGIPSISYNLNHGGSVLIDRSNPKQALPALKKMGEYIEKYNRSTVIYPEGTRSRDGKPGEFSSNGLKILCKYAPNALVVPITINNSWKVFRYGKFPLGLGNKISFLVHAPISVNEMDFKTLFEQVEKNIITDIVF